MQAHGFRFSFTPLSGVLFTFPSRYSSTIGLPAVLSLGGWCRQIRTGLLRPRPTQGSGPVGAHFRYGAVTPCGPPSQACSPTRSSSLTPALQPPARLDAPGLGWPPFARRYSGGHCCFPFLRLLGCFGSPGSPPQFADAVPPHGGFPHSGIRGSMAARASPRHFAACRALLRPWEPRASPVRPYSLARRRASPPAALCAFFHILLLGAIRMARALVSLVCLLFVVVSKSCVLLSSLSHPVNEPSRTALPFRAAWRMWGSNPRPPACKAGALGC